MIFYGINCGTVLHRKVPQEYLKSAPEKNVLKNFKIMIRFFSVFQPCTGTVPYLIVNTRHYYVRYVRLRLEIYLQCLDYASIIKKGSLLTRMTYVLVFIHNSCTQWLKFSTSHSFKNILGLILFYLYNCTYGTYIENM